MPDVAEHVSAHVPAHVVAGRDVPVAALAQAPVKADAYVTLASPTTNNGASTILAVQTNVKSYIQLGVLLGTIYILSEFDTIAMTTQGGPGTATTNLPWLIYQKIFYGYDVGHAAAMGVIVVALTYIFAVNFIRVLGQLMRGNQ